MRKTLLIDGFCFAGEKEVLLIRLEELYDIVDYFIIAESNKTQSGINKPYWFESYESEFDKFKDKIIYLKHQSTYQYRQADWSQEFELRQFLVESGLKNISYKTKLHPDDYFMLSDLDEIPRKAVILDLIFKNVQITVINHLFNSYYLNLYSEYRAWGWYGTILMKLIVLNNYNPQYLRNIKDSLPKTGNSNEGWHFSSLLVNGFETLYSKWINNIEPHDKTFLKNKDELKKQFNKCLYEDMNFFFCDKPNERTIKFKKLPLDLLPTFVQNNLDSFKNVIL